MFLGQLAHQRERLERTRRRHRRIGRTAGKRLGVGRQSADQWRRLHHLRLRGSLAAPGRPALTGLPDDGQDAANVERGALRRAVMENHSGDRRGHLDDCLGRFDLDEDLVDLDLAAHRDQPADNVRLGQAFPDVGKLELVRH